MTTTHDVALLCAAIDAGDDSALVALADALEAQGAVCVCAVCGGSGVPPYAYHNERGWMRCRPCGGWGKVIDPRAAGLRLVGDRRPYSRDCVTFDRKVSEWYRARPGQPVKKSCCRLGYRTFDKLPRPKSNWVSQIGRDHVRPYPTRSAAYLALAEALTAG